MFTRVLGGFDPQPVPCPPIETKHKKLAVASPFFFLGGGPTKMEVEIVGGAVPPDVFLLFLFFFWGGGSQEKWRSKFRAVSL